MDNIYTIGFTKKSAETFFRLIANEEIKTLLDVRLNNVSQLAGFAKKADLQYFLNIICDVDYLHLPDLAPTKEDLTKYKKGEMAWQEYEDRFLNLMANRNIERILQPNLLNDSCLLCSEHEPHLCHRRLVCEYMIESVGVELTVKHLV